MILDFRCRPPLAGIEKTAIFDADYASNFANMFHMKPDKSVFEKSVKLLVEEMKKVGCNHGVVPYRLNCGSNQELVDALADYGDRFIGTAAVDYFDKEKSLEDIDKYVVNGPLAAVNMEPGMPPAPICVDDEQLFYIYETCQEKNISVLITSNMTRPNHFNPERISRVLGTFPKLKIILTHGCLPWTSAVCQMMYCHKFLYVSPDCYLMGGPGHRDFIDGANTMIPEQIIFGSAYPVAPIGSAIEYYKNAGFRNDVLDNVMYHNGMRALGLEPESNRWHLAMYS